MLLAALVACGIGTSAANRAKRFFVPVFVQVGNRKKPLLGLLARHMCAAACSTSDTDTGRHSPQTFLSVGGHPPGASRQEQHDVGTDMRLVDKAVKLPVGSLPDFTRSVLSPVSNDVFAENMGSLYHGYCVVLPTTQSSSGYCPFEVAIFAISFSLETVIG
jgi:hypothetical protein